MVPFTLALTFLMLAFHVLLVLRFEWETLCPNVTPFPHTLHFAMLYTSLADLCEVETTNFIPLQQTTAIISHRFRKINTIFKKILIKL